MSLFDFSEEELRRYQPEREEPDDFDAFWKETLDDARRLPLDAVFEPAAVKLATVDTYDVTFSGFGGQRIKGWFLVPRHRTGPLPCVVEYIGYGGGRGNPTDWLVWSAAGCAHLVMDTRGQGSTWLHGDTPDLEPDSSSPHHPGFMTRGIYCPETYYYRRLITDAVRAVETARTRDEVDPERIVLRGISQGGGLTLAVAGLEPSVAAVLANVPFLCHYRRAVEITDELPYFEITRFLRVHRDRVDDVFRTLSYFDGVNFAVRAKSPALFSTALMDEICPPSTVFAAYNHYAGAKDVRVWRYNLHDGGGSFQIVEELAYLQKAMIIG